MTESEDEEWMDAPMGSPTEICGAVWHPPSKCCCRRPGGHPGDHIDEHGSRWPRTSKEILAAEEMEENK